ncbi:MAG: hypothetical protein KDC46_14630 [Thermoleophilia bacterium]|nr:hypothetical protein [Thermoleophilia bacterium]
MHTFVHEVLPFVFMYTCVLMLGPFVAFAMWMAFDGDRLREPEAAAAPEAAPQVAEAPKPAPRPTGHATTAA